MYSYAQKNKNAYRICNRKERSENVIKILKIGWTADDGRGCVPIVDVRDLVYSAPWASQVDFHFLARHSPSAPTRKSTSSTDRLLHSITLHSYVYLYYNNKYKRNWRNSLTSPLLVTASKYQRITYLIRITQQHQRSISQCLFFSQCVCVLLGSFEWRPRPVYCVNNNATTATLLPLKEKPEKRKCKAMSKHK